MLLAAAAACAAPPARAQGEGARGRAGTWPPGRDDARIRTRAGAEARRIDLHPADLWRCRGSRPMPTIPSCWCGNAARPAGRPGSWSRRRAASPIAWMPGGRDMPRLAGQRVLLVYGLMGDLVAALQPLGLDYMQPLAEWLRGQGGEASVVRLRTAESVSANAARLRAALLSDPRPALVIAHSKGGLEALAALLDPAAQARCSGFLAMQSPFHGSPVADVVVGAKPLEAAAGGFARLMRIGSEQGVRDLTTSARRNWMAAAEAPIRRLLAAVPVACLATVLAPGTARGRERLHLAAAQWMEKRGHGPNDGLVPVDSALIPGARHVVLPGSHIASVSRGPGRDPVAVMRAGLEALFSAAPPAAS